MRWILLSCMGSPLYLFFSAVKGSVLDYVELNVIMQAMQPLFVLYIYCWTEMQKSDKWGRLPWHKGIKFKDYFTNKIEILTMWYFKVLWCRKMAKNVVKLVYEYSLVWETVVIDNRSDDEGYISKGYYPIYICSTWTWIP